MYFIEGKINWLVPRRIVGRLLQNIIHPTSSSDDVKTCEDEVEDSCYISILNHVKEVIHVTSFGYKPCL